MQIFDQPIEFEWDKGNIGKNLKKHKVADAECEEIFFDPHKQVAKDSFHSKKEPRYILLGRTSQLRLLFVVFTIRKGRIRVISTRDINKKEKYLYEK